MNKKRNKEDNGKNKEIEFTKEIEKLVEPINVGTLHFLQFFNSLLPKKIQHKLIKSTSKKLHIWDS